MMNLKIAFRNIFRRKRRSALTALTMIGGCVLASISIGWSEGTYGYVIDMFTRNWLGHIQIHESDYLDRPALYKTLSGYEHFEKVFKSTEFVTAWAPRLYTAGLASVGEKTAAAQIIGVDPEREIQTTRFDKKIVRGKIFSGGNKKETLLGSGLAKILNAEIGDSLVIVSQAADGSIANDIYSVTGLVESGNETNDRTTLYLTLSCAQELFVLPGRFHEIALIADNIKNTKVYARRIAEALNDPHLDVAPWERVAKSFYDAMTADKRGNFILITIIMLIVAVGVLNTALMSVLERTREYGILKAMGTRPGQVISQVLYEILIMALGSAVIGTAVGAGINYWFSIDGVSFFEPITYGGMVFDRMFTIVNVLSCVIPPVVVVFASFLVSIFPAMRAAHLAPAKAMRTF